jgi:hypothetical protein
MVRVGERSRSSEGQRDLQLRMADVYSLMAILQEYSPYYRYACVNAQFRTQAQVEVRDVCGNVKFRTTPAVPGTFTESPC